MLRSVSYVYEDKFKILEHVLKKLSALSTHSCVKCTPLRQRRVVNTAMQNVYSGAVAKYCSDVK